MSKAKKAFVITFTILYSILWFALLFIIVGFFMPSPVRFCKRISGRNRKRITNKSSKYGLSDDSYLDEMMYYDSIDD